MDAKTNQEILWRASAKTDSGPIIRIGLWTVGAGMFLFMIWATFFELASAVITPGTFVSDGKNKQIQHSRGGRVLEIFVREGDKVTIGQPLLSLDKSQVKAEFTQLEARQASLLALKRRLDAERSGGLRTMTTPVFRSSNVQLRGARNTIERSEKSEPTGLALRGTGGVPLLLGDRATQQPSKEQAAQKISINFNEQAGAFNDEMIQSQRDAYRSGRNLLDKEIEALEKKAATLGKQKEGLLARLKSQQALLDMNRRELHRLRPLADAGYVAKNRLNDRQRTILELEGTITSLKLDAEGAQNQIEEVLVQIRKTKIENSDAAAKEYTKIVSELAEISDQLIAAREAVSGSIVRAPASGAISRLLVTTVGGVIGGADLIGEIVPEDAPLLIQARVQPGDIDYVQTGQEAEIAVTAFNRRIDDTLKGRVTYKSADAEKDEKTGDPFFTVRLEIKGLKGKGRDRRSDIQAGMQGEVYIHTGSRTFISYLAKPMIDSFRRAFREQ